MKPELHRESHPEAHDDPSQEAFWNTPGDPRSEVASNQHPSASGLVARAADPEEAGG